jgi:hypothetical protein
MRTSRAPVGQVTYDYEEFQPQNFMVTYVHDLGAGASKKKTTWEPSSEGWVKLSTQTYDIRPTNMTRWNIYPVMLHGLRAHELMLGITYIKFLCSITDQDNLSLTWGNDAL